MTFVLLGIGIGFLTLVPPGPVSLTLVQLGARRGRTSAMHGALGVASGDFVLAWVAVAVVGAGATMPGMAFTLGQALAAATLVGLGIALLLRPTLIDGSVDRIQRPGRALFLLTSLTPSALGAWIALLAAMPFADDSRQLALFAGGVVVASLLWHPLLGVLASSLGARLGDSGQARLSRVGGLMMTLLGIALVASQLK